MSADAGFGLRQMNRLRMLEALYRHPSSSRGDLARHTGLSRATVSTLVEELVSAGLVQEQGDDETVARTTGRPPVLLSLVPGAAFAVGLDFGHSTSASLSATSPASRSSTNGRPPRSTTPRSRASTSPTSSCATR